MVWRTCGRLQADMKSPRFRHRVDRSRTLRSVLTAAALRLYPRTAESLVWDVAARRQVAQIDSRFALPADVQFSPDGSLLAAGSIHGEARLWDAATGIERAVLKTSGSLPHVVFSPDGDLVLTATNDNTARLLKTDGTELKVLAGHQNRINAAAFSPDGLLVATGSLDGTARIWSVKDGNTVATLKGHGDRLTDVMFSEDGQSLLTASQRWNRENLERFGRQKKG